MASDWKDQTFGITAECETGTSDVATTNINSSIFKLKHKLNDLVSEPVEDNTKDLISNVTVKEEIDEDTTDLERNFITVKCENEFSQTGVDNVTDLISNIKEEISEECEVSTNFDINFVSVKCEDDLIQVKDEDVEYTSDPLAPDIEQAGMIEEVEDKKISFLTHRSSDFHETSDIQLCNGQFQVKEEIIEDVEEPFVDETTPFEPQEAESSPFQLNKGYQNQAVQTENANQETGSGERLEIAGETAEGNSNVLEEASSDNYFLGQEIPLMKTTNKRKTSTCSDCGKSFTDHEEFVTHRQTHCVAKPLICFKCNEYFPHKDTLVKHIILNCCKPYKCPECGLYLDFKPQLHDHLKQIHQWRTNFRCSICKAFFSCIGNLNKHKKNCYGQTTRSHNYGVLLSQVQEASSDNYSLGQGPLSIVTTIWGLTKENTLSAITQYKCCYCDQTFARRRDVTEHHKVSHLDSTLFTCRKCSSSFTSLQEMTSHLHVHKGKTWPSDMPSQSDYEFGHTCVDCRKYFTNRDELLNHQETDCGFKPLTCFKCGERFPHKDTLVEHIQNHCRGSSYIYCSECGLRFDLQRQLRDHHRQIHGCDSTLGRYNFTCSVCKIFFASNRSLKRHKLKNLCNGNNNHGDRPPEVSPLT